MSESPISGCVYFGRYLRMYVLIVLLSKQNLVATVGDAAMKLGRRALHVLPIDIRMRSSTVVSMAL